MTYKPLSKPLQDRLDGQLSVKSFYDSYIKLCKEHNAHIDINYYGVEVIVKDGIDYPIHSMGELNALV